jgi:hypothetical protein
MKSFPAFGRLVRSRNGETLWEYGTPFLQARLPATQTPPGLTNLPEVDTDGPGYRLLVPKPSYRLGAAVLRSFQQRSLEEAGQVEALAWLCYGADGWRMKVPAQKGSRSRVRADGIRAADRVVIEIHSHCLLDAYFSTTDDRDEIDGFIYGVMGAIWDLAPQLQFRIGHAGHFLGVMAHELFAFD